MDLESFVSGTLVQIVKGVAKAQSELKGTGAVINPGFSSASSSELTIESAGLILHVKHVTFDVAVTVGDEQSAGAGGGITVFGARLGADGKVSYENSTVSQVQFVVPLALPMTVTSEEAEKRREFSRPLNYR